MPGRLAAIHVSIIVHLARTCCTAGTIRWRRLKTWARWDMNSRPTDWQIHAYGNATHAFTNPAADNRDFGTLYQADADRRSWQAMQAYRAEVFAHDH